MRSCLHRDESLLLEFSIVDGLLGLCRTEIVATKPAAVGAGNNRQEEEAMDSIQTFRGRTQNHCPDVMALWEDAFYPNILVDNCWVPTPETAKQKAQIATRGNTFTVHMNTYNQRTKEALASLQGVVHKASFCHWLYTSFWVLCDGNPLVS
jgi:hypothetical protein